MNEDAKMLIHLNSYLYFVNENGFITFKVNNCISYFSNFQATVTWLKIYDFFHDIRKCTFAKDHNSITRLITISGQYAADVWRNSMRDIGHHPLIRDKSRSILVVEYHKDPPHPPVHTHKSSLDIISLPGCFFVFLLRAPFILFSADKGTKCSD